MAEAPQQNRNTARLVIGGIAVVLVVAFAWANSQRVRVHFLFGTRDARLIYVILGSALLGAIAGWFLSRHRYKRRNA